MSVSFLLGAVKEVGKYEVVELLQQFRMQNPPEDYEKLLKSIHSSFSLLAKLAAKTKTRVDDGLIDFIVKATEQAAEEDNISL